MFLFDCWCFFSVNSRLIEINENLIKVGDKNELVILIVFFVLFEEFVILVIFVELVLFILLLLKIFFDFEKIVFS